MMQMDVAGEDDAEDKIRRTVYRRRHERIFDAKGV